MVAALKFPYHLFRCSHPAIRWVNPPNKTVVRLRRTRRACKQAEGISVDTLNIACGGFRFLLVDFQYLVGWGIIN
jgi:hypothetical protein